MEASSFLCNVYVPSRLCNSTLESQTQELLRFCPSCAFILDKLKSRDDHYVTSQSHSQPEWAHHYTRNNSHLYEPNNYTNSGYIPYYKSLNSTAVNYTHYNSAHGKICDDPNNGYGNYDYNYQQNENTFRVKETAYLLSEFRNQQQTLKKSISDQQPPIYFRCGVCGLEIMASQKETTMKDEFYEVDKPIEPQVNGTAQKRASRVFEEEYITWENKINKEFVEFLSHIRDFVTQKETHLKEYQIDLCHRERSLQNNEDYFKERMATLKKAEEEFQQKVERLNLQIQDRMQRLRTLESQRSSLHLVNACTQTHSNETPGSHSNGLPGSHSNGSYGLHNKGVHNSESEYMYMGTQKQTKIGVTNDSGGIQPVTIETRLSVNDSGFNTPDSVDVSPAYRYENVPPLSNITHTNRGHGDENSVSASYNGERALLVKSPLDVETHTTRAHEYHVTRNTRSKSVPPEEQQRPRDRSLSPEATNRSRSVPTEVPLGSPKMAATSPEIRRSNMAAAPEIARSRSVPPEPEHAAPVHPRSLISLNEQFRNRPASFAEGQRSPEFGRSRADSFGARSVNGHASRKSNVTKPVVPRARVLRHNRNLDGSKPGSEGHHSRSLSLGNEPIGEDENEDNIQEPIRERRPRPSSMGDHKNLNSSSVTNLDDPKLRESILTKSKQASSFNMSDAIARYKAKSENLLNQDISDSSVSSKGLNSPTIAPNWDSDSAVPYKTNSHNHDLNDNGANIRTGYIPAHTLVHPAEVSRIADQAFDNPQSGLKSRIPGRRSEPFDFRSRQNKMAAPYTNSDSNIVHIKDKHDFGSTNQNPAFVPKTRVTSPKPILKNPIRPVESYHNTYSNRTTTTNRSHQPSTKTFKRHDGPPAIRRYPSDGDTNKGDRISLKSSTSDLHHIHNTQHGDSSSSHGSNQNGGHVNKVNGESPEMTSTPRDEMENPNLVTRVTSYNHRSRTEYTHRNDGPNGYSMSEGQSMSTFKGAGAPKLNSPGHSSQSQYRGSQLQHPALTGKISLRDKSTWGLKKRREQTRSPDQSEMSTGRVSRRIPAPGTYQRGLTKESRTKSDPRVSIENNNEQTGSSQIPMRHRPTSGLDPDRTSGLDQDHKTGSPRHLRSPTYGRRSHSTEGYLEGGTSRAHYNDNAYIENGNHNNSRQFVNNNNNSHNGSKNQHHDYHTRQLVHNGGSPTPQTNTHITRFDNDVIERGSDSDSELYTRKKEAKKKTGIKSRLKGLYKNSSTSKSTTNKTNSNLEGNSDQHGKTAIAQDKQLSPKHRSKLPSFNNQSKTTIK